MPTHPMRTTPRGKARDRRAPSLGLRAWTGAACSALRRFAVAAGNRLAWLKARWLAGSVPVEVLVTDLQQRRRLTLLLRHTVRRLQRTVPLAPASTRVTAVVAAYHIAAGGKQVAGCVHVRQESGVGVALIRLALHAGGHDLSDDEVLAVLTEQWIGLAVQSGGASVLIPTELATPGHAGLFGDAPAARSHRAQEDDPFVAPRRWPEPTAPHGNGRAGEPALDGRAT